MATFIIDLLSAGGRGLEETAAIAITPVVPEELPLPYLAGTRPLEKGMGWAPLASGKFPSCGQDAGPGSVPYRGSEFSCVPGAPWGR